MSYLKSISILTVSLAVSLSASAQSPAPSVAERVRQINEEIAVLNAQLQKLEVESKIQQQESVLQQRTPIGLLNQQDEMPSVRAIEGINGNLTATLAMRGGMTQTIKEGEKFGTWTAKKITGSSVTLSRGKEVVRVPFGNEPQQTVTVQPAISGTQNPGTPIELFKKP